jgi:hypothetical protein
VLIEQCISKINTQECNYELFTGAKLSRSPPRESFFFIRAC